MTINGWIQILVFAGIIIALVKPLGGYLTRVLNGERTLLSVIFGPLERGLYRVAGTNEKEEQHWTTYALAMLLFNLAGFNDDTRALLSIPARHDVWRRCVAAFLAGMVAGNVLGVADARSLVVWLSHAAARETYRL